MLIALRFRFDLSGIKSLPDLDLIDSGFWRPVPLDVESNDVVEFVSLWYPAPLIRFVLVLLFFRPLEPVLGSSVMLVLY